MELFYFIDICMAIMHRCMTAHRSTRLYKRRNLLLLTIDIMSILPYYEVYCILLRTSLGPNYNSGTDYIKLKVLLRLQYVAYMYIKLRNQPTGNQILAVVFGQLYFLVLYVMIASSVWYLLKKLNEVSWTKNLVNYKFDQTNPLEWLIICVNAIGNCYMHNWSGNIRSEITYEYSLLVVTMVIGYVFHMVIFFGDLTAQYISVFKQQIGFSSRLNITVRVLNDWQINAPIIKRTIDHYNKFWEVRRAMIEMPTIFNVLPVALQKDAMLDMFWESLQHTHLFKYSDFNFKRSLALVMKPEIYLPGDILLQKGRLKTKMFYVSAGVIQVLGENQQAAMISFSSGTVIGEMCTLTPMISHVTIRCQTYCEIYTLDITSLCTTLIQYKTTSISVKELISERIARAQLLQHPTLLKIKTRQQSITTLHWFKTHWDIIWQFSRGNIRKNSLVHQQSPEHTSKFLDLYVLSDEVELKVNVICLKATFPCILDENSSFQNFSFNLVLIATALQCAIVPYVVFFVKYFSTPISGLLYVLDIFYIYGLYIDLSTAFRIDQRVITDIKKIILHKIKKISMMIDILATVPIELFAMIVYTDPNVVLRLHLNRVLKVHRMLVAMQMAERNLWLNPLWLKLLRYSLIALYLIYLICGVMYGVACPNECSRYGWYAYNHELENHVYNFTLPDNQKPQAFLSSFSYAISIFLTLTDSMYVVYVPLDMVVKLIVCFIGFCIYSFAFSELAACAVVQMMQNTSHLEYLTKIRYFVSQYEIPSNTKRMIYMVTQCHWDYSERLALTGVKGILNDAPENIKNSVLYNRIVQSLKKTYLFTYLGDDIIWNIAPTIRLHIVPPGTVLCRETAFASHIQIILRGYAKAESTIPTDEYHGLSSNLKPYDVFPIIELALGVKTFVKVRAVTFVEVAVIPFHKVMGQLKNNNMPRFKHFQAAVEAHRKANYIILMRCKGRLPEMVSAIKSFGKGEYFVYETNEKFDDSPIDKNVMGPYLKLGKWKCVRYFFLPSSISPTKKFYVIWESIRCTIIFLNVLYIFFFRKHCEVLGISEYIELFFLSNFLFDTYIRMHCQYYDKNGVLINHPLSTSSHYLTGSFIADLYANFPFTILSFQRLFHGIAEFYVSHVVMLLTRPVAMYRIYYGLSYIEQRSGEFKSLMLNRLKHIIVGLVILGVVACMQEHFTCHYAAIDNYYCPNYTWIARSPFRNHMDFTSMIIISFYQTVTMFACASSGIFIMRTRRELILYVVFAIILLGVRLFILLKIVALSIKGNVQLVEYQHNVKLMIKFMRDKLLGEEIIKEITDHYENLYMKTQGCDANAILSTFFPMMTRDISNYMYRDILTSAQLFADADAAEIRFLCHFCKEVHFKKDAHIIRYNQVQDSVYIVYKGLVEISIAQTKLKTLTPGGMFGCFVPRKTRQTITATALVHVELLVMNSVVLCNALQKYPQIRQSLKTIQMMNEEFLVSVRKIPKVALKKRAVPIEVKKRYIDRFMINANSKWYGWYEHLMKMHFSPIASMFTISFIINHDRGIHQIWELYAIDVIFLSKVVLAFFLTYTDHETGLRVKTFRNIIKRYFLKFGGFPTDFITCVPVELITSIFVSIGEDRYRYYLINRSFRFIHMINYYNNCKNKLTVSKTLKWTYLMYVLVLLIHFISCFWFVISCPNRVCHILDIEEKEKSMISSVDENLNLRMTYQYVVSTFTSTGIRDQVPSTITELIITIMMIFIFQILVIALQSEFATLLSVGKYVMNKYGEMVENLRIYMQSTHVSISIIDTVNMYLLNVWVRHSGHCVPILIELAPYYLKQDIMFQLYGHHLMNHPLFVRTHTDFIKQLVMHIKVETYMPGQHIIQMGDVDNTIYFISQGKVRMIKTLDSCLILDCILETGASFGEYEGFKKVAHLRTAQAANSCLILSLHTTEWEYLLALFPASKEILNEYIEIFHH